MKIEQIRLTPSENPVTGPMYNHQSCSTLVCERRNFPGPTMGLSSGNGRNDGKASECIPNTPRQNGNVSQNAVEESQPRGASMTDQVWQYQPQTLTRTVDTVFFAALFLATTQQGGGQQAPHRLSTIFAKRKYNQAVKG